MRTSSWLVLLLLPLLSSTAAAQPKRYELGQRLKRFESAWEQQTDPAARQRALAILPGVSSQFLSLQLGEAGRTLDEARFALTSADPPSADVRWLEALYAVPSTRLVVHGKSEVTVEVRRFYSVKGEVPAKAAVRARIGDGPPVEAPLDRLPVSLKLPPIHRPDEKEERSGVRPIDAHLVVEMLLDGRPVTRQPFLICRLPDQAADLFGPTLKRLPRAIETLEQATLKDRAELFESLAGGFVPETDLPAGRLFDESHALAAARPDRPYFTPERPGRFWLSVPTGKNRTTPCRLLVPKGLDPAKPVPLVVALHGAGGSENLFFEGYGAGHIVKECEQRGWLLVAPRSGGLLGGVPPVPAIVAKLAERYPIDRKRVFLVGHSMGAGQAVELVQQSPGTFAAVALLGGVGRVRKPEAFAGVPVFIGVGGKDALALTGSRALNKALGGVESNRVTYREYPDLEHLVIVREALPDVFTAWDAVAGRGK
jgi:predicted esterase